jgi:serine protease Do
MAIGNPFRLSNSVSVGIVSAVGRPQMASISTRGRGARFEEMIQTDAAINKGNSGGPLLNIRGEVVGINTSIYSDNDAGGNIGIGFALPINRVVGLLPQLRTGKVTRGRIGVSLVTARLTKEDAEDRGLPSAAGAIISDVDNDGPGKAAGLKMDDVVIEFNGKPVTNNESLIAMVTATAPGSTVPMKVVRNRKTLTLNVKVDELNLAEEQGQEAPVPSRASRGANEAESKAFGMNIQEITPNEARRLNLQGKAGGIVSWIDPLGAAAEAGVEAGDVILSVNGAPVTTLESLDKALNNVPSGRTARLVLLGRGGERLALVRKK